jgi:GNAT superfamily N-acetyltransferase
MADSVEAEKDIHSRGSGLIIRESSPADLQAWLPLWDGYNTFYKRTVPINVTENTWRRFHDPQEPMHALLAEKETQVVGFVHFLFHRNTSLLGDTCYLQDLFTAESARGTGIGRALILSVYEKAREAGAEKVYWRTHESNHTARILYDKIAVNTGFLVYNKNL